MLQMTHCSVSLRSFVLLTKWSDTLWIQFCPLLSFTTIEEVATGNSAKRVTLTCKTSKGFPSGRTISNWDWSSSVVPLSGSASSVCRPLRPREQVTCSTVPWKKKPARPSYLLPSIWDGPESPFPVPSTFRGRKVQRRSFSWESEFHAKRIFGICSTHNSTTTFPQVRTHTTTTFFFSHWKPKGALGKRPIANFPRWWASLPMINGFIGLLAFKLPIWELDHF